MRFLLAILMTLPLAASAMSPGAIGVRGPVGVPIVLDSSTVNVLSGFWVQFAAAANMPYACSAIQIHNTGAQPVKLGIGPATQEVDTGLVFPIGVSILVPIQLKKGVRLAVRSVGQTQSTGYLTMTCFQ